jgi:Putative transposase, YhgA-like
MRSILVVDDVQHDFTDRSIRELLSRPDNLREFLEAAVPDLAGGFAVEQMQPASREFLVGNWRRRSPDLLLEIPYRAADQESLALVCVLLEHQSRTDWQVPLKTFVYAALYWEWQWRVWEEAKAPKPDFALTPILPLVLHTGPRPWGSARTLRELLAPPAAFHGFVPEWQPLFWDLATHSTDELLNSHAVLLQALTILKADQSEQAEAERLFVEVFRRLDPLHDTAFARWKQMLLFLLGWALNRRPAAERPQWQTLAVQMQTTADRQREIENMGMTIAQSIFQEGRQEGREEGLLQHAHNTLIRFARKRLGEPDDAVRLAIESNADLGRLDRMIDRVDVAGSWADLLATT